MLMALTFVACYLIGAIPFGVLVGRACGIDVRSVGSGNIGATNVYRTLGPKAGIPVFLLDVGKGLVAPWIARWQLGPTQHSAIAICAVLAVIGHTFSVFIGFRGGKGIATSLGAMFGLAPVPALFSFALWAVMVAISKYISVASIVASLAVPIVAWVAGAPREYVMVIGAMGLIALVKHIPNMKRLRAGTEPKLNQKKADTKTNES